MRFSTAIFVWVLFGMVGVGCASTKAAAAPSSRSEVSAIKAIVPPSGASTVVLYKKTAFKSLFGPVRIQSNVFVDQAPTGDISDYQYAVIHLKPGRHNLRTFAAVSGTNLSATKTINTEPNRVHFVEMQSSQGWNSANVKLEEMSADALAQAEVAQHCAFAFEADLTTGAQ